MMKFKKSNKDENDGLAFVNELNEIAKQQAMAKAETARKVELALFENEQAIVVQALKEHKQKFIDKKVEYSIQRGDFYRRINEEELSKKPWHIFVPFDVEPCQTTKTWLENMRWILLYADGKYYIKPNLERRKWYEKIFDGCKEWIEKIFHINEASINEDESEDDEYYEALEFEIDEKNRNEEHS